VIYLNNQYKVFVSVSLEQFDRYQYILVCARYATTEFR